MNANHCYFTSVGDIFGSQSAMTQACPVHPTCDSYLSFPRRVSLFRGLSDRGFVPKESNGASAEAFVSVQE